MRSVPNRWIGFALLIFTVAITAVVVPRATATSQATPPTGQATPGVFSCATASSPSTPMAMEGMGEMDHGDMEMGQPVEFDQVYIDMMIPHHQSIIAMAQASLPELTDERLVALAETIIATQQTEIDELRGYRSAWYGSPDPAPMDEMLMARVDEVMPEAHDLMMGDDGTMAMMDPVALTARFCAAPDPDLAFIDLTIPHHQAAVAAAEAALEQAVHPETRDNAQRVIDSQTSEIAEMTEIRAELTGVATPMATPAA